MAAAEEVLQWKLMEEGEAEGLLMLGRVEMLMLTEKL